MGSLMAKNILKSGFSLTVYNRTISKTKELEKLDAQVAKSPKELASQVDVVITMVTAGHDVESVLFGKNGVVKSKKQGLTVIDMSTIGPIAAKKIAKKLEKYQIDFFDAPVTGSTPKALTGELTIFIGGNENKYNQIKKILLAMGKTLHFVGPIGSGQAIKLVNNLIIASTVETLAEGMLLAKEMNLSLTKAAEILETVPAISPMMNLKLANFVNNKFPLLFSMSNMTKDLKLALAEMKKINKNLPALKQMTKLYTEANKKLSKEDYSIIIKMLN